MADFKLGRIKFKWRGDWAASTAYLIDDIVKYGGNTYVVFKITHLQSTKTYFIQSRTYTATGLTIDLYYKGTRQQTWYKLNDLVKYGQRQYGTTTAHTSSQF